jgi:hypothetical protein
MQRFAITSLCVLASAGILWLLVEWRGSTASVEDDAGRLASTRESRRLDDPGRSRSSDFGKGSREVSRPGASEAATAPSARRVELDRSIDPGLERTLADVGDGASDFEAREHRDTRNAAPSDPELPRLERQAAELAREFGLGGDQAAGDKALADQVVLTLLAFRKYGEDATPQQIQFAMGQGTTLLSLPEGDVVRGKELRTAPGLIPLLPPQYLAPEAPRRSSGDPTSGSPPR